jgi:hypothetical protein
MNPSHSAGFIANQRGLDNKFPNLFSKKNNMLGKNVVHVAVVASNDQALPTKTYESKASLNLTLMLISVSFLYIVGTMPYILFKIAEYANAPMSNSSRTVVRRWPSLVCSPSRA